jgi:uncharacterized protein
MLELRPVCEHCSKALPPEALDARICSFECTFCAACVEAHFCAGCPNCGGNFVPRPIRPVRNWKNQNCLDKYPAAVVQRHRPVDLNAYAALAAALNSLPPEQR